MPFFLGKISLFLAKNMLYNYKAHCPKINNHSYFGSTFKLRHHEHCFSPEDAVESRTDTGWPTFNKN